jgi:cytochrome P450
MLTINEDLLGPEAIDDPYTYYGRLREEDPIHWNPLYETWVITRYDDVVWCLRHPELFSSEIFLRDARPPFPPILDTDHALYEFNKKYLSHWFIRRDTPDHLRMRRVVHPYFNPRSIEGRFRTLVREVIHDLLAEVEAQGHMEVLQDSLNLSLRHEVARVIVWHFVTRPVVPSAVSYADVREGNAPYRACEHGTHSH